jgi:hypothetical protein
MSVSIRYEEPPLFAELDAAFHIKGKPVIFCFGDVIYNPMRVPVSRELGVHEAVHSSRQGDTEEMVFAWWRRYIAEPQFRFYEEMLAHQAEYRAFRANHRGVSERDRALHQISQRLASALYGNMVSWKEAKRLLRNGALTA